MSEQPARLKSEIWVKAQIRICDVQSIPAFVRHRGDSEAGTVILLLDDLKGNVQVFSTAFDAEGQRGWLPAHGATPMSPPEAEAYLGRRMNVDPDIWVVEIEDPQDHYVLDGPILK